ncbi:uncharacterized protein LOC143529647 [Bidens hawaiensis]|uniref:uncharacterized protein LOC143529647 n=1 Tax=Bidens hawaiensis TaxID=980011 RepID=UPI00404A83B5
MTSNTYDQEEDHMISQQDLSNTNPTWRQYSRFMNPRILRVSRSYGGKDRHTKVWTIRGLKDRRIRLSEHAALQLYRLQDQLGLSQPSKVIDWLLDVTKDDIAKLPPLQMALEDYNFNPFHFPSTFTHQDFNSTQVSFPSLFNNPDCDHQRTKGKEVCVENRLSSYNYNELHPSSNLSLSRYGHDRLDHTNYSASLLPSSLSSSFEPRFLSSFSGTATPSFFPQHIAHNHSQLMNSSYPHVLLGLNMNSTVSSESNDEP